MNDEGDGKFSLRERMLRFCTAFMKERRLAAGEIQADVPAGGEAGSAPTPEDKYAFLLPSTRPYPGLRAFTPGEARIFFGRLKEAGELRKRLADNNVVVVLGGSGSGKSSLVLAGVLPRLNDVGRIPGRTGRWYAASFRPGDNPCQRMVDALWDDICMPLLALKQGPQAFDEILDGAPADADQDGHGSLAELRDRYMAIMQPDGALTVEGLNAFLAKLDDIDDRIADLRGSSRSGGINFLLLIDQFEELFRDKVKNEKQKDIKTIVNLLNHARKHREEALVVVVTLRSEELHRCTEIDGLAPVVNSGFYLVDRPNIEALDTAAVSPGRQTLQDWGVAIGNDNGSNVADEKPEESPTGPFSRDFIGKLKEWITSFQENEFAVQLSTARRKRHQADLLPLFQHLLRMSWTAAVERWTREPPENKATVETSDIEEWIRARSRRVGELRRWMQANFAVAVSDDNRGRLDNILERCFDVAFAITLSEAITGKRWDQLEAWPPSDEKMLRRLRLIQAAFVALATRDDKGNDARRPASAAEILAASHDAAGEGELKDVLSYFKNRDYLQGGENGERYDVSHEALIRNSSEYQAWLTDAKNVTDALTRANAVLYATRAHMINLKSETTPATRIWRSLRRMLDKVLWFLQGVWDLCSFSDLRKAATRFSEPMSRELGRIFGANAVFSPVWMADRAQLAETAKGQERATQKIEAAWTKAYRWHVDIDWRPGTDTSHEARRQSFESRIIKRFQTILAEGKSPSRPINGWMILALRAFLSLVLLVGVLPTSYLYNKATIVPLEEWNKSFPAYAREDRTNDYRLKLLLLAAALRSDQGWLPSLLIDSNPVQEAIQEALLRSPVFAGSFVSAAWDYQGRYIVSLKGKYQDFEVYDLLNLSNSPIKFPKLPYVQEEDGYAPPPSIGLAQQKDGTFVTAFRIATGAVWRGKDGKDLTLKTSLPERKDANGEWIPRADIFRNYVRIIFWNIEKSFINKMAVSQLVAPDFESSDKKTLDWQPAARQAIRQPVLAEDCDVYAFLGQNEETAKKEEDTNPYFALWFGRLDNSPAHSVPLNGKLLVGGVAVTRECGSIVVRDESENGGKLHIVLLDKDRNPSELPSISLRDWEATFNAPRPPAYPQKQPIFAAAALSGNDWRVGWQTPGGLALLDVSRNPSAARPSLAKKEQSNQELGTMSLDILTGVDVGDGTGSLSFSPDGLFALFTQQKTYLDPIQLRAFDLRFESRREALKKLTKSELIAEACRIAGLHDGGNRLTEKELGTWLKDRNAHQPCY